MYSNSIVYLFILTWLNTGTVTSAANERIFQKSFEYGKDLHLFCNFNQEVQLRKIDGKLTAPNLVKVTWRKDGIELLQQTNTLYNTSLIKENTTLTLFKSNITHKDEGTYECTFNGKTYSKFKVYVYSTVKILNNDEVRIELHGQMNLVCIGSPDMDMTWMIPFDVEEYNDTVVTPPDQNKIKITVPHLNHNQTGAYTCIGTRIVNDEIEEASNTVWVVITDKKGSDFPENIWFWLIFGIICIALAGFVTGFVYYRNTKKLREDHGVAYLRSNTD